jgi:hypothetical protein
MKKKKEVHPSEALASRLKHFYNQGKLFKPTESHHKIDRNETQDLTEEGQHAIREAIQYCLKNNITPNCSVSGDNREPNADVSSLTQLRYEDLIEKLELIPFSEGIHFYSRTPLP